MLHDRNPSLGLVLVCVAPILLSGAFLKLGHPLFAALCFVPTVGLLVFILFQRRRTRRNQGDDREK
jgi:uncharacterized membrane protein YdjX (TVP38/TMEM64 family)